jgi:hypothetical protein
MAHICIPFSPATHQGPTRANTQVGPIFKWTWLSAPSILLLSEFLCLDNPGAPKDPNDLYHPSPSPYPHPTTPLNLDRALSSWTSSPLSIELPFVHGLLALL